MSLGADGGTCRLAQQCAASVGPICKLGGILRGIARLYLRYQPGIER